MNSTLFCGTIELERVDGYPTRMTATLEYDPYQKVLRVMLYTDGT